MNTPSFNLLKKVFAKYSLLFAISLCVITGCLSLDPFLFKEENVSEYKLDDYTGETECKDAIDFLNANNYPLPYIDTVRIKSCRETLYGMLLREDVSPLNPSDTIILYFHGTTDHIDRYWPRTRLLFAVGYPTLTIDYRGYGKSTGKPTEKGIYEDGRAALQFIKDSLSIDSSVIVYAYSLGSLVGCEVTSTDTQNQIIQLILEAPIGSVETLVQDASYLNLPGSYVTTFTGNNAKKIEKVTIPLLWIHGTEDETLNRETNGLPVWNNHTGEKGCYIVTGAGHRNNPETIGYARYLKCLRDFIRDVDDKDELLNCKP